MVSTSFLFILAFVALWVGSGLAVKTITSLAHTLRISSFFASFFVLGLFTSITEIFVGINAVIENKPEIFVGNLLGSSVVVFILIIPLLAVVGNGVRLNHFFRFKNLVSAVFVVGFPALLTLDNRISLIDAIICIAVYGYFILMLEKESGVVDKMLHVDISQKKLILSFFKIIAALTLVFAGSNILVQQTPRLGELLNISPYVISILLIAIGTNIPELSIAARSILSKNKDVAFGNYVGSAAFNTLEMGILSLLTKTPISANGSNFSVLTFLVGLSIFVYFVKSKNDISRKEGSFLLLCYFLFVFFELFTGSRWNLSIF